MLWSNNHTRASCTFIVKVWCELTKNNVYETLHVLLMRLVGVLWVKEGENIIAQCINTRSLDIQHYRD